MTLATADSAVRIAAALDQRAIEMTDASLHDLLRAAAEELRNLHGEREQAWAQLDEMVAPKPDAIDRAIAQAEALVRNFGISARDADLPRAARVRYAETLLVVEQMVGMLKVAR